MACGAAVETGAARCESCYSQLDDEVKAFECPRCGKVLELGTPKCPKCSMKFKAKAVRPSDEAEDQRMVSRLIDWSRRARPERSEPAEEEEPVAPTLTAEETEALSSLLRKLTELVDVRSELASGMSGRVSEARARISRLVGTDPSAINIDDLDAELAGLSEDLRRSDELISKTRALSEDFSRAFSMPGLSAMIGDRAVSITVPTSFVEGQNVTDASLREREEQVRKREEMVDRKIKSYAQKKKELDMLEASRSSGVSGDEPEAAARKRDLAAEKRAATLAYKVRTIHELMSADGACDDIEPCLSSLEGHLRGLVVTRSEMEQRVAQIEEGEAEVRELLKTLDGLLGQLPTEVIQKFSKTEEFKLYERVLDRLSV